MRRFPGPFALLGIALIFAPCLAQEEVHQLPARGTEAFRVLLQATGCRTLKHLEDLAQEPKDTLLIVFGKLEVLDQLPGGWLHFHQRGGALLLASDQEENRRLQPLGVRFHHLPLLQDPNHAYRQWSDFPLVVPTGLFPHPLWLGVHRGLATYRPGVLILDAATSPLRPLGYLDHLLGPATGKPPPHFQVRWWFGRQRQLFLAAGREADHGPVVILASASPFQNQLLLQEDNDNWTFARNVLRWLTNNGRRRRVLFLEEGEVRTALVLPPPRLPRPSVEILDELLCNLEEEDCFNRALLQLADLPTYLRLAAGAGTLLLLLAGLRRLWRGYYRNEPAPLLEAVGNRIWLSPPLLVQRRQAWLRQHQASEAGRELARLWLGSWGLTPAPTAPPPQVLTRGGWWQRWRWRRQIRRLWELACAPTPLPLRLREFQRLRQRLAELDTACQAGLLWLEPSPEDSP